MLKRNKGSKKSNMIIFVLSVVMLAFIVWINPQLGIILTLSLILHELGHAIVASHYGLFKKFILTSNGFAVQRGNTNSYTKNVHISIAGFLFSLIPIAIGGYFFLDIIETCIIFFCSVIGSTADFRNIINYGKIYKKGCYGRKGDGFKENLLKEYAGGVE